MMWTPEEALYCLELPAFDMGNDEIMDGVVKVFRAYARGTLEVGSLADDPEAVQRGAHELDKVIGGGYSAEDLTVISQRVLRAAGAGEQ